MNKLAKVVSFTIIFALMISLFAGLDLFGEDPVQVNADGTSTDYEVLVITNRSSNAVNTSSLAKAIKSVFDTDLGAVNVTSMNVGDFNNNTTAVKDVNLIVVDMSLSANDLTWNAAKAIFDKVIGKNGPSAKFLISSDAYGTGSDLTNAGSTPVTYIYRYANQGYKFDRTMNNISVTANGSTKNIYKLFLMLNAYQNPGTFNSIFFNDDSASYGIVVDGDVAYLRGWGSGATTTNSVEVSGEGSVAEGKVYEVWSIESLKPFHIMSSGSNISMLGYNTTLSLLNGYRANEAGLIYATNKTDFENDDFKNAFKSSYGVSGSNKVSLSNVNTANCDMNDFRLLVVQPNYSTGDNRSNKVDRSAALSIFKAYKDIYGKVIGGGVVVDYMSAFEFNSTSKNLNSSYDAIYFGYESDVEVYGWSASRGNFHDTFKYDYPGQKLSTKMKNALTDFDGKIIFSSALKAVKSSIGNLGSFADGAIIDSSNTFSYEKNSSNAVYKVVKEIEDSKATLNLVKTPQLYTAEDNFTVTNENAMYDYYYYKQKPITESDYINGSGRSSKLNYTLRINGNGTGYSLKLYIDLDSDGIFKEGSKDIESIDGRYVNHGGEVFKTETGLEAGKEYNYSWNVLPEGYVGAVPWRVDLLNASGKVVDSKTGYSACKAKEGEKTKINLLQIVVDTDINNYSATDLQYISNSFYVPTEAEYNSAYTKNSNKAITSFSADTNDGLKKISEYFSGALSINVCGGIKNGSWSYGLDHIAANVAGLDNITKYRTETLSITSNGNDTKNSILYNAGLFYYFMKKLDDYDISCTRFSLYELEQEWKKAEGSRKIHYNSETGVITYTDSLGNDVKCDLLLVGFADAMIRRDFVLNSGNSSEQLNDNTVNMIYGYINKGGYSLVGRGIVNTDSNEKLTKKLRSVLGMEGQEGVGTYTPNGQANNSGNGGNAQSLRVNVGALTKYPYDVPITFNGTNAAAPIYNLNVNDTTIVGYFTGAAVTRGSSIDMAAGNSVENYQMYRKGRITYANIGFTEGNAVGQKAITLKLPEAVMLVNVIVNSIDTPAGPSSAVAPDIEPGNPGVNETPKKKNVPDPSYPNPATAPQVEVDYDEDFFFIDYEVNDDGSVSTRAMNNDPYVPVKERTVGENTTTETYQRVVFTSTDGPSTLKFTTGEGSNEKTIPADKLPIFRVTEKNPDGTPKTYVQIGTDEKIKDGETYFVDIPVFDKFYEDNVGLSNHGLDQAGNDRLKIKVEIIPENSSAPHGYEEFIISRRGMFKIN